MHKNQGIEQICVWSLVRHRTRFKRQDSSRLKTVLGSELSRQTQIWSGMIFLCIYATNGTHFLDQNCVWRDCSDPRTVFNRELSCKCTIQFLPKNCLQSRSVSAQTQIWSRMIFCALMPSYSEDKRYTGQCSKHNDQCWTVLYECI